VIITSPWLLVNCAKLSQDIGALSVQELRRKIFWALPDCPAELREQLVSNCFNASGQIFRRQNVIRMYLVVEAAKVVERSALESHEGQRTGFHVVEHNLNEQVSFDPHVLIERARAHVYLDPIVDHVTEREVFEVDSAPLNVVDCQLLSVRD
jgi:hypothetical protein